MKGEAISRGFRCLTLPLVIAAVLGPAAGGAAAADSVYWSDFGADGISFAALDGSTAGDLTTTGATLSNPEGVAIDTAAGRIYWANDNSIAYANLNGSGGGTLNTTGATMVSSGAGVAIDPAGGRIYWANRFANKIAYANLNGTGGADLNTTGATVDSPAGVALDLAAGRIYWANENAGISYADLSGGGGGQLNTTGATVNGPWGVAIDPVSRRIYWANRNGGTISYASLSGGGGGDLDTTGATVSDAIGVAIDPVAGRIYWADQVPKQIWSASLTGGAGRQLPTLSANVSFPSFLALLKAPAAAGPPTVSGGSAPGSALSCSQGAWAPDLDGTFLFQAPRTFTYQWLRDGAEIAGAEGSTIAADTPGRYTCRVTATNHAGSTAEVSAPLTVADARFKIGKPKLNRRKGTAKVPVTVPGAGELELEGKTIASKSKAVDAGTTKLLVKPKGKVKRKLAASGRATLKATVTFTPTDATGSKQGLRVKLKRK